MTRKLNRRLAEKFGTVPAKSDELLLERQLAEYRKLMAKKPLLDRPKPRKREEAEALLREFRKIERNRRAHRDLD